MTKPQHAGANSNKPVRVHQPTIALRFACACAQAPGVASTTCDCGVLIVQGTVGAGGIADGTQGTVAAVELAIGNLSRRGATCGQEHIADRVCDRPGCGRQHSSCHSATATPRPPGGLHTIVSGTPGWLHTTCTPPTVQTPPSPHHIVGPLMPSLLATLLLLIPYVQVPVQERSY